MSKTTQSRKQDAPAARAAVKRVAPNGASRPGALAARLDDALTNCWLGHKEAFKQCRRKPKPKAVHDLRVSLRRVQSLLLLLRSLLPAKRVGRLVDELDARLKALSGLRDTQMLRQRINAELPDSPYTRAFAASLRRRQLRLAARIASTLGRHEHRKLKRKWDRIVADIVSTSKSRRGLDRTNTAITEAIDHAFGRLLKRYRRIDASRTATIHRTRIAFKTFRYMVEARACLAPGISTGRLRAMSNQQARMGEIQDIDILLTGLEKFLHKTGAPAGTITQLQRPLLARRDKLVARFLASAKELPSMWPIPAAK